MVKVLADQSFVLSPTDISKSSDCEFGWLRSVDEQIERIVKIDVNPDAMLEQAAKLGDAHEQRELARLRHEFGAYDPSTSSGVIEFERPRPYTPENLLAANAATIDALKAGADVVFQAVLFDGTLAGFADFIRRGQDGKYEVWDTKLARHAKVSALLQIAAYAVFLEDSGIPLSPVGHLLLGDGKDSTHNLDDIVPVYRARRRRLETILTSHLRESGPTAWNDPRYSMCGSCGHCSAEIAASSDLLLVAGMRQSQRTKLRAAGLETIHQLAEHVGGVDGLPARTLEKLRAQAALQVQQAPADALGRTAVLSEVFDPLPIANLPAADEGDIFFDFEGDPLWSDSSGQDWGLEYLFGIVEPDETDRGKFVAFWAHDRTEEKRALSNFFDYVRTRWTAHPGMHIYHYAAYEVSALKRLVVRHQHGEDFLDQLLRAGVFVDLYKAVRQSVRVSQPSYSIKKLEPLYMGDQLRSEDGVTNAADSVVMYQHYCEAREAGDSVTAASQLDQIKDYNWYDCTSTWYLNEWLRQQIPMIPCSGMGIDAPTFTGVEDDDDSALAEVQDTIDALMASVPDKDRTDEQQATAMMAAAIGYHSREMKPFWWTYFDRLISPIDEWTEIRGTLIADDQPTLEEEWGVQGSERARRRTIRIVGRLESGSTIVVGATVHGVYEDVPDDWARFEGALRAVGADATVVSVDSDELGRDVIVVREKVARDCDEFDAMPIAIFEHTVIRAGALETACLELARRVLDALPGRMPAQPAFDVLARRVPRLTEGEFDSTAIGGASDIDNILATIRLLDRSYLAVQGPPGTGKTHVGSHVVTKLIADGWRIGVIAQSHKAVENFLGATIDAGAPASSVGKVPKAKTKHEGAWTSLKKNADVADFLAAPGGRLVGGTAWTFANANYIDNEQLDLLVIDEAGQFSLANTVAASRSASRLLLLGDPQQLPQVSRGTHPEPIDQSALSWIANGHETLPTDRGFFLSRTWRMHSALTKPVSRLAYEGRLESMIEATDARCLEGVAPGLHIIPVEHGGNDQYSVEEAAEVVHIVESLIGSPWKSGPTATARPLTATDILILAPYNAQVGAISASLERAGFGQTKVGTVDKFQGQEAAIAIVSLAASSAADVPRGIDFLINRNRLNVAISRGQWATYFVRSPALSDYLPSTPSGLEELGAFIRLLDA